MVIELTYEERYADLVAADSRTLPERYFTIVQFAEDIGKGRQAAARELAQKVEDGSLLTKLALVDGYYTHIYWFPGTDDTNA